jgi:hypothetical protein
LGKKEGNVIGNVRLQYAARHTILFLAAAQPRSPLGEITLGRCQPPEGGANSAGFAKRGLCRFAFPFNMALLI